MSLSVEDAARIGGSDIAGILGLSPWSTPLSIYARVVAALERRALAREDNGQMRRGRHLEAAVLRLYEEETGYTVVPTPGTYPLDKPWQRASLDAVAYAAENAHDRRVVEVKTAGLSEVRHWGEAGTDAIPQHYLFQCEWYLGHAIRTRMVELTVADVAALVAGDLRIYHASHDAELFAMLEAAAERFWVDHVLPRRPPPVTEPLRDADAAGALYPRHNGEAKDWSELATEDQVAVREWLRAREERMDAERTEKAWEARVRLLLATTPSLRGLPPDTGVRRVDWKQNKPGTATDWRGALEAMRYRGDVSPMQYAEIVKEFTTTKEGARPLKAYAIREEEQ